MDKKLVLEALRYYLKTVSVDGNLYARGLCDTPHARKCALKRRDLLVAIKELEDENLSLSSLTTKGK